MVFYLFSVLVQGTKRAENISTRISRPDVVINSQEKKMGKCMVVGMEIFQSIRAGKLCLGRVTQGKACEFLMFDLQQSFEDLVVCFPSDALGCRLQAPSSKCYLKQKKTIKIAIIVHR